MSELLATLSFVTPAALLALLALPIIWWLLRFTPPRPAQLAFPPVRILLELKNKQFTSDRTPWWLLLLRLVIATLVILGVSHPLLKPGGLPGAASAPLLLVVDNGWASAVDWAKRRDIAFEIVEEAEAAGETIALATTAPQAEARNLDMRSAADVRRELSSLQPQPLASDRTGLLQRLSAVYASVPKLRVAWLADGLGQAEATTFATGLSKLANGQATVNAYLPRMEHLPLALAPLERSGGQIVIKALRPSASSPKTVEAAALAGNGRELARVKLEFPGNALETTAKLELPVELRNQAERIALVNQANTAATVLLDDQWRRKTVALLAGQSIEQAQPLLSPLYYVSRALEPYAEMTEPASSDQLKQSLDAGLSMLVLADVNVLSPEDHDNIVPWLERGGVLVRFAGPRLAATQDDLLPVKLREGGRELGSSMGWEAPQPLTSFAGSTPFGDLKPDEQVTVSRQVLAEPDADLSTKVWASLADGTPLVTAAPSGRGMIVLFHVTATPDWSTLPLSGQFVDMLKRLVDRAPSAGAAGAAGNAAAFMDAGVFRPRVVLTATGDLQAASPDIRGLTLEQLQTTKASPLTPAGIYARGQSERAINLVTSLDSVSAITTLPSPVTLRELVPQQRLSLARALFTAALLLFLLDTLISLIMGGAFVRKTSAAAAVLAALLVTQPAPSRAADDDALLNAATALRLAYVRTGDAETDAKSEQGLKGLTLVLSDRTSVRAEPPVGIDMDADDLVFYPLLYWPVRPNGEEPSTAALAKLDSFMKNGGTIFFDLLDDGLEFGADGGASDALRKILAKVSVPPLEPVPPEHVLTKSFYLLSDFPGRYDSGKLWVERNEAGSTSNVDGVSSLIVGSNDYAAAWAIDDAGQSLYAVVPPNERQREMAFRVGVNVVMYVLTGNYKSDQVHVPALLERLGQ